MIETNVYQVHVHRNKERIVLDHTKCTFNLEGQIEFGGSLRYVIFDNNIANITPTVGECRNTVFKGKN
jgi:hypothetical protein